MLFLNLRESAIEYWKHATRKRIELNLPKSVELSQSEYYKNIIEFTTIEELNDLSDEDVKLTSQLIQMRLIGLDYLRLDMMLIKRCVFEICYPFSNSYNGL